jgi:hypothetical protein
MRSVECIPRVLAIVIILVLIDFNDLLEDAQNPYLSDSLDSPGGLPRSRNADRDVLGPLSVNGLVGP